MDRLYDLPGLGTLAKIARVKRNLAEIRRKLRATAPELAELRTAALRSVCLHAFRRSPFYRELWSAASLREADLSALRDPSALPVVSKEQLRSAWPHGLCADPVTLRRAHAIRTTGSTGTPVRVALDREKVLFTIALFSRPSMEMHLGLRLGRGLHVMVRSPQAIEGQALREFPAAEESFLDALSPVDVLIEELNRRRPQYVLSYPGIVGAIAAEARRRGVALWQPEHLVFSGESLTARAVASIRRSFPDAVFAQAYCATEVGGIAVQCHEGKGLHTLEYQTVVEVLDDGDRPAAPGVTGRIVVTDLRNRVTPVIRYAGLADLGAWAEERCACPLAAFPLLGRLDGRAAEAVRVPGGPIVHQFVLTSALERLGEVAAFQVRHETATRVRLLLVPEPAAGEARREALRAEGAERLRPLLPGMTIEVELVAELAREPGSHKTPAVVSLVPATESPG